MATRICSGLGSCFIYGKSRRGMNSVYATFWGQRTKAIERRINGADGCYHYTR